MTHDSNPHLPTPPGTLTSAGPRVTILSSVHLALDNRVYYREAQTLRRAGYRVTLFAVHDRNETRDGVRIWALPRVPRWQRPLLWRRILLMARRSAADVYHIHDPELLTVTPWLRRLTGRPTIYDIHEANEDFIAVKDYIPAVVRGPLARAFGAVEPRLARWESGLIFADDAIAAAFDHIDRPKTTLFNFPGAPLIEAGGAPAAPLEARQPVILYLGGLERNRGSALMIDAFARVVEQLPEARLLVVGHLEPPSLEAEVRADVAARGLTHAVTLTCRVPFEQIGHYLRQAQVGWVTWQPYPKNEKNIPTKLFEYMAYGLPIVTGDLPSTRPFMQHGVNGLKVQPDDPAAHVAALLRLLQHPAAAAEMGRAGRRLVEERYNWAAMEPRLLALYEAVLGDRPADALIP